MALPIKETPILTGADAKKFEREIKQNKTRKIPKAEYVQAMDNYYRIKIRDDA